MKNLKELIVDKLKINKNILQIEIKINDISIK